MTNTEITPNKGLGIRYYIRRLNRVWRLWSAGVQNQKYRNEFDTVMKRVITGKSVLIIGSGPSAGELKFIPEDLKVLTCHRGLDLVFKLRTSKPLGVYLTTRSKARRLGIAESLLPQIKTESFVINACDYAKKRPWVNDSCENYLYDDGRDNFMLKKLISPLRVRHLKDNSNYILKQTQDPWTSAGVRLLQYALFFEAKEIFIIGLDIEGDRYFTGEHKRIPMKHTVMDFNFIKHMSNRHKNIYSLTETSPINRFIPYHDPFSACSKK